MSSSSLPFTPLYLHLPLLKDQAISTFNFLNNEDRYVGLAAIPPEITETFDEERELVRERQQRRNILDMEAPFPLVSQGLDDVLPPIQEKSSRINAGELPLKEEDWSYKKWGPPRQ